MADLEARVQELEQQNKALMMALANSIKGNKHMYASEDACQAESDHECTMPILGNSSQHCLQLVRDRHVLDSREGLNTSSYVNVFFEDEETEVAKIGLSINLADQTVYPESFKVHNITLNMVAKLWHCPVPYDFEETGVFAGAGTVGSTEACLLAGLCLKFRWRKWYADRHPELDANQIYSVRPNMVISTCFQAAWEKLFRYMDIEPKMVTPDTSFKITPEAVKELVDENTIGVVCILGNHYAGQYDPVWEIDAMLTDLNAEKGWEVGIHVDAASGGFVAPFQPEMADKPWDFRLPNVLSISASGHKFGESCCGTGWIVWRQRDGLSEHVAVSVSYLGGKGDSYTLNFSRPASGVYVQYYKFHRLGLDGYRRLTANRQANASFLRHSLKEMTYHGKPRFVFCDDGDTGCLPVVAAYLNPDLKLSYDSIDLQHAVAQYHWYVSGYKMSFTHPITEEEGQLLLDQPEGRAMFRVVVKGNVTRRMIDHLINSFKQALDDLDQISEHITGHRSLQKVMTLRTTTQHHKGHAC